jgi:crotonobetainyl-CoA:carnitine CoA-transferase CaiB-like acyl-CoA transferase
VTAADPTDLLLSQAWAALGADQADLGLITFTGDGHGLLPSNRAALPALTAAVATSTVAASLLDAARRTAPPVSVFIDLEHVAVAARSEHYARSEAVVRSDRISPLSMFWETADGRSFRIHGEYPWHYERALRVLACDDRHRSVKQAVASWRADDLEEALAAARALGYAVRTEEEWITHPQGQAVACFPLLQTVVGQGPVHFHIPGRVASGFRVLDLTRVLAGPIATRTLAGWGAEVLRVDSPRLPELPVHALDTLSGKRSANLDLADSAGRARLEELLDAADLLVQGYRPGALTRFGLDPLDLSLRHPHLNVVTLSAWGPTGPWSDRRGFDSLVQCPTGLALAEGQDGRPGWLPAQVLDHATGYLAAAAGLLALAAAQEDQKPRSVQLSLAQTARWLNGAGTADRDSPRQVDVDAYRIRLAGAVAPVEVIRPPGRLADLSPSWSFTTELGSEPPTFDEAEAG